MDILIHIGYHKTGTTWLQRELFSEGNSFFEPLANSKGQNLFAWHFFTDPKRNLLNSFELNQENIQKELEQILSERKKNPEKMWVLSHERLSGNPHSGGFDSLSISRRLQSVFPNGKVLIMIREQSSFILSNYFQYLSIGGNHGLKKYLQTPYDGKRPGFSPGHLFYHHLIEEYYHLFGKENVLVLPYELFKTDKTGFTKKLGEFTDQPVELSDETTKVFHNKKQNHFLNYHLRFLNRLARSTSVNNYSSLKTIPGRLLITGIIGALGLLIPASLNHGIQKRLNKKIIKWMGDRYKDSNLKTNELIEADLKEFGYF